MNNNHGNLFKAITAAVCAKPRLFFPASIFSHLFLSVFPPLINKQHFRDSSKLKFTKSAHLQCSCPRCVWPSLVCPFSHNARHPPDNSVRPLPSILTWEISLSQYVLCLICYSSLLSLALSRSDLLHWLISPTIVTGYQPDASSAQADTLRSSWSVPQTDGVHLAFWGLGATLWLLVL